MHNPMNFLIRLAHTYGSYLCPRVPTARFLDRLGPESAPISDILYALPSSTLITHCPAPQPNSLTTVSLTTPIPSWTQDKPRS